MDWILLCIKTSLQKGIISVAANQVAGGSGLLSFLSETLSGFLPL
jgi:hypothetical protein